MKAWLSVSYTNFKVNHNKSVLQAISVLISDFRNLLAPALISDPDLIHIGSASGDLRDIGDGGLKIDQVQLADKHTSKR